MAIDLRTVKCGCGNEDCKIGFRFDGHPDVMLVTDKEGFDVCIMLTLENTDELIDELTMIKNRLKRKKR